jgi:hypothetical protein
VIRCVHETRGGTLSGVDDNTIRLMMTHCLEQCEPGDKLRRTRAKKMMALGYSATEMKVISALANKLWRLTCDTLEGDESVAWTDRVSLGYGAIEVLADHYRDHVIPAMALFNKMLADRRREKGD